MSKEPLYTKISKYIKYENIPDKNKLIKSLVIWANTNAILDEYYSRPNMNITNDKRGLNIKNSMRHTVAQH
mgnify:CR=1 FL=1